MTSVSRPAQTWSPTLILIWICLPVFIGALDLTVVSAVLPHVIYDLEIPLQTGLDDAAWVVSGYLLAYTVAMTFMGRLSDLWGRRRIYLAALLIFAVGSVWVATADQYPAHWGLIAYRMLSGTRADPARMALWALIAGRVVQALGGGAMVPVSMAIIGDLFPSDQRAGPLGLVGAVDTAGWVVGHLYGGVVARYFDWRVIFWLNLPACALAWGLIAWALRSVPQPRGSGHFDWLGAGLLSGALVSLTLGVGGGHLTAATFGAQAPPQWNAPLLGVAGLCLAGFVAASRHQTYPLVPLAVFRDPGVAAAGLVNLGLGFSLVIAIANVPLFINSLVAVDLKQGAWDSGWLLSGLTVPMAITAWAGGWLQPRLGYRWTVWPGLGLATAGFIGMSWWTPQTPYAAMLAPLALAGVGLGLVMTPSTTVVVNWAPADQRGVLSALVIVLRLSGMTVGLASMTTYGLQRATALLEAAGPAASDPARLLQVGAQTVNQVIAETFWVAAGVCVLTLLPAWCLSAERPPSLDARRPLVKGKD